MQTITYKCDRRKKESTNKDVLDLEEICIGYRTKNYNSYTQSYTIDHYRALHAEWCKECRKELGLTEEKRKASNTPTPTLEDYIREIVAEVVNNN